MNPGIITLTTDFGIGGHYVAAVKGVLIELAPGVQIVDVCHTISPQNVLEGGFVLANIVDAFPAGTVHLAVIDPGVGTDRHLMAFSVARQWFVLPDNGLITGVTRSRPPDEIREITSPAIRRAVVSATFHGRDILAPAAAHLAMGRSPAELGPTRSQIHHAPQLRAVCRRIRLRRRGDLQGHLRQPDHQHPRRAARTAPGRVPGRSRSPASGFRASCTPTANGPPAPSSPWWAARAGSRSPSSTAMPAGS